jgi:hypothetical protein
MTTAFISTEALQERFGSSNEIRPIIASMSKQKIEFPDAGVKADALNSRMREMLSWEFFVNELEFE